MRAVTMDMQRLVRAENLVVADARRGDPTLSYEDALTDAVDGASRVPVYGDDELADAYRIVLASRVSPTRAELLNLLVRVERGDMLTLREEVWMWRLERGALR